jgi:hypothetical protein
MSYVITVRRSSNKHPLSEEDIRDCVESDNSLTLLDSGTIEWRSPDTKEKFLLNIEETNIWTDHTRGVSADELLAKLQGIAATLNADVYGEEGELLSSDSNYYKADAASSLLGVTLTILALPFLALLFVIRLPLLLWQIARSVK